MNKNDMNKLYYGDCLSVMSKWDPEFIDLIYLDPPFNTNRLYNAIYEDETGRPLPDQLEAYCDMWELNEERERAITAMPVVLRQHGIDDTTVEFLVMWMKALRNTNQRMLAYLSYMAERLVVMHRILKPTGSIYLHCDPTASHYLKVLMDAIFDHKLFRRELIWDLQTSSGYKSKAENFIRGHDTILYYSKGSRNITFNKPYMPYSEDYKARFKKVDKDGRRYRDDRSGGRKQYLDASPGVALTDVWSDIMSFQQHSSAKERMGYETQKPLPLLERIIKASSNEGDVVLDPFCGCATTLEAAHNAKRRWIGIDITIHAVKRVARVRLNERLGLLQGKDYVIQGIPRDIEGAIDLWQHSKYQFQKWAIENVEGFVTTKKTADGGIDGRLYFAVPDEKELQSMIIEVKGGQNVTATMLRSLIGTLKQSSALMAGLITMRTLPKIQLRNFKRIASKEGTLKVLGKEYPRVQILSVEEILADKLFETPSVVGRHREYNPLLL